MSVRFLFDEDLPQRIAEIARGLGLDAVSVHEIGRRGFSDAEQLSFAASEKRVLVTRNRNDFIKLTIYRFQTSQPHEGVLIVARGLPNHHPDRVAHELVRWSQQQQAASSTTFVLDFLSAGGSGGGSR